MAEKTDACHDVIVIGAGFGGASCAGLLAKRGLDVLLVEKNKIAGGKAMSLSKKGFTYTAWVVIGAPVQGNYYQRILDELDVAQLAKLVVPGRSGSIYKTAAGAYTQLPSMPPDRTDPNVIFDWLQIPQADRPGALQFFAELTLMPPDQVARLSGTSFDGWIRARAVPRSLYAFLVSLCCDGMFMVPADALDAAEAIASLQDMFLRSGGVFCEGGFGRIAEACCEAVRRNGGTVLMGTRSERILVEAGRVTGVQTPQGSFRAPIVVSNAGIQPTVLKLVGEEHFDRGYTSRIKELVPSYSLIGHRYFLSRPVTDMPYGVIFSDASPWSLARFNEARAGRASREGVVYYEVPSNYDPQAAPAGKQILISGSWCPPDPELNEKENRAWADAGEQILFAALPGLETAIESKDLYTTRSVSSATRDGVLPGVGGETIGLGQIVGQCGAAKPAIESPLGGLFYVGCDAGGQGVGTQQAIESGFKVAEAVYRHHHLRKATAA